MSAWPENPSGHGGEDMKYRFQWTAPIAASPHDPKVIYHGAQVIFRTSNGGQSWDVISPDLTRNDKSKQKWSGGPITGDNTGVETYDTVFAIAESPMQKGLIWAGTDDGLVQSRTTAVRTGPTSPAAMPGMPEWGTISLIEPSPFDPSIAYVVVDAHRLDNMRPYLYKTTDYGQTWKRLDAKLPQDVYLHAVREDPKKKGQLYLGTERGVMFSTDGGETWRDLRLNLPTVAVHDLVVKGDDLVVATHGRSIWILDDLRPVRDFDAAIASSNVAPVSGCRRHPVASRRRRRTAHARRASRIRRVALRSTYFLKEKPKGELRIEILDAQGTIVRTLSSVPREPDGSEDNEDLEELEERPRCRSTPECTGRRMGSGLAGCHENQGWQDRYGRSDRRATCRSGPIHRAAHASTERHRLHRCGFCRIRVATASQADLEAQLTHALRVRDDVSQAHRARQRSAIGEGAAEGAGQGARAAQVRVRRHRAVERVGRHREEGGRPRRQAAQSDRGGGVRHSRDARRHALYSRLAPLQMWAIEAEGPPTAGMVQVLAAQEKELSDLERETTNFIEEEVGTLNATAVKLGLSFVIVK